MKEFTCSTGHEFNSSECKEQWQGMWPCPYCWPNGFLNPTDKSKNIENMQIKLNLNIEQLREIIFWGDCTDGEGRCSIDKDLLNKFEIIEEFYTEEYFKEKTPSQGDYE